MILIIDIDGSISDIGLRASRAGKQPGKANKAAFQMWLDRLQNNRTLAKDKPIEQTIWLIKQLAKAKKTKLFYLTGRAEKYRKVTQGWLDRMKCPEAVLYMRPNDNYQSALKYKEAKMLEIVKGNPSHQLLVLDDDGEGNCSKMYKRNGWCHLKVMWNV